MSNMFASGFRLQASGFLLKLAACSLQLAAIIFLSTYCYAQVVSSSTLINQAKQYDGQTVIYAGEVVGEIMARQDYAWINVHDGKNAIGIWANKALTKNIITTGSYKSYGDWVKVEGIFHRACPEHGGDTDIHAERLSIIQPGETTVHSLEPTKVKVSIILAAIMVVLAIAYLIVRGLR